MRQKKLVINKMQTSHKCC